MRRDDKLPELVRKTRVVDRVWKKMIAAPYHMAALIYGKHRNMHN